MWMESHDGMGYCILEGKQQQLFEVEVGYCKGRQKRFELYPGKPGLGRVL